MGYSIAHVLVGSAFLTSVALAQGGRAQSGPTQVQILGGTPAAWAPGTPAPLDIDGNRALDTAPVAGAAVRTPGDDAGGVLRGLPNWRAFGPSGADAKSVAASPTAAGVVVAGVASSVGGGAIYRSTDGGVNWSLTSGTGNRAVREVEFGPTGAGWAATENGLFRSTDNGATWSQVGLPVAGQALVRDVAVDPTNASVVWAGLGQFLDGVSPQVLFKTTNGGTTWTDVSPPVTPGMGVTLIGVDPADPQRVYAAFTPNFGGSNQLWITTDGGTTWVERSAGMPNVPLNDAAFGPGGVVYIAGGQDFGGQFLGLYSTTDDGVNWTDMSAAWPSRAANAVSVSPVNPQHIFVGTTRAGLARSTDGGASWTFGAGGTGTYEVSDVEFVPGSPSNILLGLGSVAVFRSTNGGEAFTPSSSGISRLEITSFAVNPLDNNEIAASYIGVNDGGIFISTDGGATWSLSQAPLPRWQKVYFAPNGVLYGTHNGPLGRADDGLWRRNANGTWTNLGPGSPSTLDNIGLEIAATTGPNPVILWGGYRWFNNFGAQIWTYNRIAPNTWEKEYEGSISNENVYTMLWLNGGAGPAALAGIVNFGSGAGAIFRTTNFGDTWAPSQNGYPSAWNAWKLVQGPQSPDTVYLASSAGTGSLNGAVFRTVDGGLNWTQQGSNPAYRYLAADPLLAGTLYALLPFNNATPQRSENEGAGFSAFDNGFIPLAGGRDIVYGGVVGGERRLYVATGAGGYATDLPGGAPPCPADWNGDNVVNSSDLSAFITSWLDSVQNGNLIADFNGDGAVNSSDLSAFITAWLAAVQGGC